MKHDIEKGRNLKPIKRSKLRVFLGKSFYRTQRYLEWYLGRKIYAKRIEEEVCNNLIAEHKTPLMRKLKDVDMWLQQNKVINLKLAIKRLDGVVIRPGETMSYWRLIGKPTRSKGYVDGMVLYYGGFKAGTGGGLCQLSNLIYWMTLHTTLKVTERYRHSFDVFPDSNRTQPFGSGATCVYNYRDLQICNGTNQSFQLRLCIDGEYLKGEWKGQYPQNFKYEVYEKEHYFNHEFWGGYTRHNTIYRRVYTMDNGLLRDEYVTENHAVMMYEPFLTEGNK